MQALGVLQSDPRENTAVEVHLALPHHVRAREQREEREQADNRKTEHQPVAGSPASEVDRQGDPDALGWNGLGTRFPAERGFQFVNRLEALRGILLQTPQDGAVDTLWQIGLEQSRRSRGLVDVLPRQGDRRIALKGCTPGEHLVEHQTQRVDVAAMIDRVSLRLFGTHVGRRAGDGPGLRRVSPSGSCNTEVTDFYRSVPRKQDVFRLQVTMRDLLGMRFAERCADLASPLDARAQGNGAVAAKHVAKALAFDVFHGNGRRLAEAMQLVCAADVSVRNLAGQPELVPESLERDRIARDLRPENLQCHELAGFAVTSTVDDAHVAATISASKVEAVAERAQWCFGWSGDPSAQDGRQIIVERAAERAARPQERIDIIALAEQIVERRAKLRMACAGGVEKRGARFDRLPQRRGEQGVGVGLGLSWRCCSCSHRRDSSEHRFAKPGLGCQPIALDGASGD